ncbi:MAG: hypothetical protein K2P84_13140, partial [Undibacterium sp.]|nr:hypothetical protein [Undibacterium sp.]
MNVAVLLHIPSLGEVAFGAARSGQVQEKTQINLPIFTYEKSSLYSGISSLFTCADEHKLRKISVIFSPLCKPS